MTSPNAVPPEVPDALRAVVVQAPTAKDGRRSQPHNFFVGSSDTVVQSIGGPVQAGRDVYVQRADSPRYTPAAPIHASELQATSVAEFLDLLRELLKRSGVTRKRIAERSGVPQSTVYHLLSPKTTTLPTKMGQVRALAIACGLASDQVERVVRLWAELRELPAVAVVDVDQAADAVGVDQAVERPTAQGRVRSAARLWRTANGNNRMLVLFSFALCAFAVTTLVWFRSDFHVIALVGIVTAGMAGMFGLRHMTKSSVVVEQHTHPNGSVMTVERRERLDGVVTYVERITHADGRVDFTTRDEQKRPPLMI